MCSKMTQVVFSFKFIFQSRWCGGQQLPCFREGRTRKWRQGCPSLMFHSLVLAVWLIRESLLVHNSISHLRPANAHSSCKSHSCTCRIGVWLDDSTNLRKTNGRRFERACQNDKPFLFHHTFKNTTPFYSAMYRICPPYRAVIWQRTFL